MKTAITILGLFALAALAWMLFQNEAVAPETVSPDDTNSAETSPVSETAAGTEDVSVDVSATADVAGGTDTEADVVIDMTGTNYAFDVTEIRVQEGDVVTINLTSAEGFHDIVLDEFSVASEQIRAGESTRVTFVADAVGTYEYYCSVGNHRAQGMVGTLIVE